MPVNAKSPRNGIFPNLPGQHRKSKGFRKPGSGFEAPMVKLSRSSDVAAIASTQTASFAYDFAIIIRAANYAKIKARACSLVL